MKKRSKLCLIGTTALMLFPIMGCAGGGTDDGHTILLWSTFNDSYQAVFDSAVRSFKEKYPEYTVKTPKQTGSYSDLANMIKKGAGAGNYPDMVAVYPDSVAEFMMAGIALDISDYMNDPEIGWTNEDFQDIPKDYIEEGQSYVVEGTYSLPFCKSTEALYYNRGKLVGIELHDDDINDGKALDDAYLQSLTWDELFDKLCPALVAYNDSLPEDQKIMKPATDKKVTYVVGCHSDDNLFITLSKQYGLGYTSVENYKGRIDWVKQNAAGDFVDVADGYTELLRKFIKAYKDGYFITSGAFGTSASNIYQGGGMLFSIGSTGGVKYAYDTNNANDVGVAMIPQNADSDRNYIINQGPSIAFLRRGEAGSEAQKLRARGAWLFYKEFTSYDLNAAWAVATGYAPIRKSVSSHPDFVATATPENQPEKSLQKLQAYTTKYVASNMDSLYSTPVFYGSASVRKAVENLMGDILKNVDPDADDYAAQLKAKFEQAYNNAV